MSETRVQLVFILVYTRVKEYLCTITDGVFAVCFSDDTIGSMLETVTSHRYAELPISSVTDNRSAEEEPIGDRTRYYLTTN